MVSVGEYNRLEILRIIAPGAYLDDGKKGILLPKRFLPQNAKAGDWVDVFIYHDSDDRLIATTQQPKAVLGDIALLEAVSVTPTGAFLDWGLMKDLFVPKSKQLSGMRKGGRYLVKLYLDDQTGRIAASEKIDHFLSNENLTVKENDEVQLTIYRQTPLGYVVIINHVHTGLLHHADAFKGYEVGDSFQGFIKAIRPENLIDVVPGQKGYKKVEGESEKILELLREHGGYLPYHDKSDPDDIADFFGMSKKTFKMTTGKLYKEKKILFTQTGIKLLAILTFLFFPILGFCQSMMGLNKQELSIIKEVNQQLEQNLRLLEESVNINSGTYNIAGVKKVGELYGKELAAMGFKVEWIALPDSLKRAGHLVAYKKGGSGKRLFLIGHLDTVFEPDMPFTPFTKLNDSTATGQGVNDMKGGDVVIIGALKALHKLGLLKDANITVYMTGDEENAGHPTSVSRYDFIERAKQHDIALAFETASTLNIVATARRGASGWKLEVEGKQAHSSGVFGAGGYGSIYEAARIVNTFREKLSSEPYLTFNPGLFVGGSEVSYNENKQQGTVSGKTNIISPKTVVVGDLRFLSEEQKQKARDTMSAIVSQNLPGSSAKIQFNDGIPSMPPTPGNEALASKVSEISQKMGLGPVLPGNPGARGAGDISYIAAYLNCLDGLGASGKGAHAPGETIKLNEFPLLIQRTALLLNELSH